MGMWGHEGRVWGYEGRVWGCGGIRESVWVH